MSAGIPNPPAAPSSPETALDQRFRKSERLLRRADFVRLQTTGRRFKSKRLAIAWLPRSPDAAPSDGAPADRTRIGITVSRKVGDSPTRSRVKRVLREVFRLNKDRWPRGVDFVVIARPPARWSSHERLRNDMLRWADELRRDAKKAAAEARRAALAPTGSDDGAMTDGGDP